MPGNQPKPKLKTRHSSRKWWVYLLACRDGRTYAGVALDVLARFDAHVAGKAAKFTRANRPQSILGARSFATKSAALKAEYALKQLTKTAKLAWARKHPFKPAPARQGPTKVAT